MDSRALAAFIVLAKRATDVGGGGKVAPSRPGSHDLECIVVGGVEAYALDYFGGLIKP